MSTAIPRHTNCVLCENEKASTLTVFANSTQLKYRMHLRAFRSIETLISKKDKTEFENTFFRLTGKLYKWQ